MSDGGEVENEKLHPEHEEPMAPGMREDEMAMDDEGDNMSGDDMLSKGGSVVDEILAGRKKFSKGGAIEADSEEDVDMAPRMNLEREHYMEDDAHEVNPDPSEDDHGLVGEILKERKMRRRG